ncbi:peptidylprolyl isomerase [Hathewaya histolytica]|uniref:peptidylprolyl isomerase n=1 Tax=Hathewaya histolytica TaxID=1498 RepID=UPI003B66DE5B
MDNNVLAKVNGIEITEENLNALMSSLDPQVAMQFYSPEGKERLLEELINQELFYAEALDKNFAEEEEFKNEVERIKKNTLKQYALRKVLAEAKVTEEEAEEFYNSHKESYSKPEEVRASHILVDTEEKANEILKDIKEGKSFEDAAKENSKCPSSSVGGDLGAFAKGRMVPEFEEAAFKMEIGDISEAVKTQFGYHIIKLTEKTPAGVAPFEEVKSQVYNAVLGMKQQEKYMDKAKQLREKFNVEIVK